MKPNILFVIPALRTVEYTELAYRSLKENTNGVDYDVIVCMDLDNADDRKYYEDHCIPYKIRQGWGHWTMVNWEVFDAEWIGKPYNFVGLIHNDMVFGYDWLSGFRRYCEEHPDIEHYDNKVFSFKPTCGSPSPHPPVCLLDKFNYQEFQNVTMQLYDAGSTAETYFDRYLEFLPWIWSFRAHKKTFKWLRDGDYGLLMAAKQNVNWFDPIHFPFAGYFHFGNIACTLCHDDFMRIQATKYYFQEKANDPDFMELCNFLLAETPWKNDAGLHEIKAMSKL